MKIICKMKHLELEKELTAKIRKRRLLEGGVTVFLFVMGIVFAILYDNSKVYEKGLLGGLGVVDSNMALYWLMAGCFMAAAVCAIIFPLSIFCTPNSKPLKLVEDILPYTAEC